MEINILLFVTLKFYFRLMFLREAGSSLVSMAQSVIFQMKLGLIKILVLKSFLISRDNIIAMLNIHPTPPIRFF